MDEYSIRAHVADASVVLATPLLADGGLDLDGLELLIAHVAAGGVRTMVVGGNTGEFHSMTAPEYRRQFEVARAAADQTVLFGGIAGPVESAARMGTTLVAGGADALMIHHPVNPYATPTGVGRYFADVANNVDGPVIVYPRGQTFTPESLEQMEPAENIVGVKYGHADVGQFAKLTSSRPDLVWSCGLAENWAPEFWPHGATGFTSGLGNVSPERAIRMLEALRSGDKTRIHEAREQICDFESLRALNNDGNNVAVIKAAMKEIGLPAGPLRPPLTALDDEGYKRVCEILTRWHLR